jgi:GntR family transcriptional regulator
MAARSALDSPPHLYYCNSTVHNAPGPPLMLIRVSAHDGVPIYLQIVNQVKYLVASKRLSPGDALPSVRKLAEQLVVNPNTVARAYRELEAAGILTTRPGAGVYVSDAGSPLSRGEQMKILTERVDVLLAEAQHLNVDLDALIELIRKRSRRLSLSSAGDAS